ncbi:MAG TPA: hypothetical protein VMZ25_09955 [Terriglobales bacterium]|nr:hypothetical protein [Terriglobales bacterium]
MTLRNVHVEVQEIMLQSRAERWRRTAEQESLLESHLAECAECSLQMQAIQVSLSEVQAVSASIAASSTLVRSTQLRVRARARAMKKQEEFMRPLWFAALLAFLWAGASMPFLWQGFAWLGKNNNLPDMMWVSGFVIMSLMPAAAVGTIALARSQKAAAA